MPIVNLTLPETSQSISRPIIFDIINQVQEITKISKDSKIIFPGDAEQMSNPGSTIDDVGSRFPTFSGGRYTFIEVTETPDEGSVSTRAVNRPEHIPVFIDELLGVEITPIYESTNVTISFRYTTNSKTEAKRWKDDMVMKISQLRDINLHHITYHYLLPNPILSLLHEVYTKRESIAGYGETLEEYILKHSTERLTFMGNLTGEEKRLSISEKQIRIIGRYDFDAMPDELEKDNETARWTVTFGYTFSYEKPTACNVRYPVMVHNQLLDPEYVEFYGKGEGLDKVSKSFPLSLSAMHSFEVETIMNNRMEHDVYIRIPTFDDFITRNIPVGTGTVLTALLEVDVEDKRTLLNLRELGDIALDEDILEFIEKSEYPYVNQLYKSIIHISLYRNQELTYHDNISCDNNLNIKAKDELNLRNNHRVRFSLVIDISLLTKEAIERLKKYPKAFVKIIQAINEIFRNIPDFNKLANYKKITDRDFNDIHRAITGIEYDGYNNRFNARCGPPGYVSQLLSHVDPYYLENYRRNNISRKTVMLTSICSYLSNKEE